MRNRKHRGVALITAIWILALLLILVGGFAAMTQSELQVARNHGDLTRATWAARAGIRRAETAVQQAVAAPYTALDGTQLLLASTDDGEALAQVDYTTTLTDEAGKLNLNTADLATLEAFLPTEEAASVAASIVDWRDEDSTPGPDGAEDDYYMGLSAPYHCKNAPFETVGELLQVKGVTRELLSTVMTEDGQTVEDLLTVCSQDTNTDAQGEPRLNITTATQEEWTQAFGEMLTTEEMQAIIQQRTTSRFSSPAALLQVQEMTREKLAQMYDRLTATTDRARPGLVNLNTAPVEVLAVLPGMDGTIAEAIDAYRTTTGPLTGVGDLLLIDAVDDEVFTQVADHVTTRSRRFRVVSVGSHPEGVSRTITCIVLVDPDSGNGIRTLYWRE